MLRNNIFPKLNRLFVVMLILVLLSSCSVSTVRETDPSTIQRIIQDYPELKQQPYSIERVKRVVDGDTFVTESGDRIRLIGVNTPESVKPNTPVEFFAKEASQYTKVQLSGQTVALFADVEDEDRYRRKLRYVFLLEEGSSEEITMYNEQLLAEGYAGTMTIPPNVMYADYFVQIEAEARQLNKGLWSDKASQAEDAAHSCEHPNIKGNINSKGDKIYHVPDGAYYNVTKAEVMFCTEQEAQDAGFRASKA